MARSKPGRAKGSAPRNRRNPDRARSGASGLGLGPWLVWTGCIVVLAVVTGLAVHHKIAPAREAVFRHDGVRLIGADSYYHLRHARTAAAEGVQRWDPSTHYPRGHRSRNAALFDWIGGAAATWLAADVPTTDDVATAIAWIPPICAGFACVLLFAIGWTLAGKLGGLFAATCFALYPGNAAIKMLVGFADHHALEVVLALAALTGLCLALQSEHSSVRRWVVGWASAAGVSLVIFFFAWAGAPLFIALVAAALAASCIAEVARGHTVESVARVGVWSFGTLAGGVLVIGLASRDAVLMPHLFWPLVLGAGFAALGFAGAGPVVSALCESRHRRLVTTAIFLVPGALVALVLLLIPGVRLALTAAFSKVSTVAEHQREGLWWTFGPLVLVGALGIVGSLARGRAVEVFAAVAALGMVTIFAVSGDYGYLAAPMMSVAAVVGASTLVKIGTKGRLTALGIAAAVAAPVGLGWTADPWASPAQIEAAIVYSDAWEQANRWLRESTEKPTLDLDSTTFGPWGDDFAYPEGTYGVVVPWSYGNFVAAMGRRPVFWSQGVSQTLAKILTAPNEAAALDLIRIEGGKGPEHLRYIVLDAETLGPQVVSLFRQAGRPIKAKKLGRRIVTRQYKLNLLSYGERFDHSLAAQLYLRDGDDSGRFRLVYETLSQQLVGYRLNANRARVGRVALVVNDGNRDDMERLASAKMPSPTEYGFVYDAAIGSSIKVFRIEEGAVLTGVAPGGSEVIATLELHSPTTGRSFTYRRSARAGADGNYRIRVAYPSGADPHASVTARGPYQVQADGGVSLATVTADAVHKGAEVSVGSPRDVAGLDPTSTANEEAP